MYKKAEAIKRYHDKQVKLICEEAMLTVGELYEYDITVGELYEYDIIHTSCPHKYASDVCHALLQDRPVADIAMTYSRLANGKWRHDLRSREDGPDVSKIAQGYGGGGHKNAAGFIIERPKL